MILKILHNYVSVFTLFFIFLCATSFTGNCITINYNKSGYSNACSQDTLIFDIANKAGKTNYNWKISYIFPSSSITNISTGNTGTLIITGNLADADAFKVFTVDVSADSSNGSVVTKATDFLKIRPTPKLNLGGNKNICPNSSILIDNIVSPGPNTYNYKWYITTLGGSSISTDTAYKALSPAKYYVLIGDSDPLAANCTVVGSVNVISLGKPTVKAISTSGKPVRCAGKDLLLDVDFLTQSTPPYSYKWTLAAGLAFSELTKKSPAVTPNSPNTYKVVVSDANTCKDSSTIAISINPVMGTTIAGSNNITLCKYNTATLTPISSGGSVTGLGYSYLWTPSIGLNNASISSPIVSPLAYDGIAYIVTSKDAANCTATDTITIKKVRLELGLKDFTSDTLPLCSGSTLNLNISRKWGKPAFTFVSTSTGTFLNKSNDSTYVTSQINNSSKFYFMVTDADNCTDKDSLIVNIIPSPKLNIGNREKIACIGKSLSIDISPTITGTYTYLWSPNTNISNNAISNPIFKSGQEVAAKVYNIVATDVVSGCITKDSIYLKSFPLPQFKITPPTEKVFVGTLAGFSSNAPSTTTSVWSIPQLSPTVIAGATLSFTFDTAKVYNIILKGTDPIGCSNVDTLKLRVKRNATIVPYIPNVFAPAASDLRNTTFRLFDEDTLLSTTNFRARVYNIAGQLVYSTDSYKEMTTIGWSGDGYTSGVYTYYIIGALKGITKDDEIPYEAKGGVTLLR